MNLLKKIASITFLFIFMQYSYADETYNLKAIIDSNDLNKAMNMSKVLKHSFAQYGDTKKDTYYNFDKPKIKLLDFPIETCTVTLFDKKVGHISIAFKEKENSEKLVNLLSSLMGDPKKTISTDDIEQLWLGDTDLHYELFKPSYSDEYSFSITNDTYRKFNKKYNGN